MADLDAAELSDLPSCPHCGGHHTPEMSKAGEQIVFSVSCMDCGFRTPQAESIDAAKQEWRRAYGRHVLERGANKILGKMMESL